MKWSLLLLILGLVAFTQVRADEEDLDDLLDNLDLSDLDDSEEELLRQFEEKNSVSLV